MEALRAGDVSFVLVCRVKRVQEVVGRADTRHNEYEAGDSLWVWLSDDHGRSMGTTRVTSSSSRVQSLCGQR